MSFLRKEIQMEQFEGLKLEKEQDFADTTFEDCGQENPFEEVDESGSCFEESEDDAFWEDDDENENESTVESRPKESEEKSGTTEQSEILGKETVPAADTDESDLEEKRKRAEHEASEARRKAEWEARQQAKRDAEKTQIERVQAMSDEELMAESMKRVSADTEKLTRRNMKECVAEYIQTLCVEDPAFARMVMSPKKNMVRCFQYISRKAWGYVQDELKANGIQPQRGAQPYGCDIPDDLCYHWAEEYFRTPDVKEDQEEEEKFVPKPYCGGRSSGSKKKKKGEKKAASPKPETKKAEEKPAPNDGQLSFLGQLSFENAAVPEVKAG